MLLFVILLVFILVAAGLAWYLISHDRGEREPVGALWIAASFGLLGAVLAALIESKFLSSKNLVPGAPLIPLLGSSLAVGVIEEGCKFIPLSFFIYKKRYFNEHTDGVIYFALAGLGFGLPENLLYSLQFGAATGLGRLILTPIFHAAITAMVGYYLAKNKLAYKSRWLILLPLGAAMLLHGIYDFGLASGINWFTLLSIIITLGVSIGLFILYMRATDLDQDSGLSAVGHNNYCRSCGFANPRHHLYCTRCGQYA